MGVAEGAGFRTARFILTKHGGQTIMMKKNSAPRRNLIVVLGLLIPFLFLFQAFAENKRIAILPLALYADPGKDYLRQGIRSMLASRLHGEGLQVLGDRSMATFLQEGEEKHGITTSERAGELAEHLQADYVIFGSITGTGTGYSLDLSILDLTKEQPRVTNVSEAATEDQLIPKMADVAYDFRAIIAGVDIRRRDTGQAASLTGAGTGMGLFFRPVEGQIAFQPKGRFKVSMEIMSFDMGDLDGNGSPELLVLGRKKLLIYAMEEGRPILKGTLEPSFGEDFLKVTVGDSNGDGKSEIFLASRYGDRARSTVYEWQGNLVQRHQRTGHMQIMRNRAGEKSLVLYQDSLVNAFFSGAILMMNQDGAGQFSPKDPLPPFQKNAQFYSLLIADLNMDGNPEYIGLGESDYLHVWNKEGEILWTSDEKIGGTTNAIPIGKRLPGDLQPRTVFNSRAAVVDVDNDGKRELVVIQNIPLIKHTAQLHLYNESRLIAFKMVNAGLVHAWKSKEIKYCLVDMEASGSTLFVAAQEPKIDNISQGSGAIMWFE